MTEEEYQPGLNGDGFYPNPKQVHAPDTEPNYGQNSDYNDQDEVRDWETQGRFGPGSKAFEVFSEFLNSSEEELEEEVATDGGREVYTEDGGYDIR